MIFPYLKGNWFQTLFPKKIEFSFRRRGYVYAANWRRRNEGNSRSYFYTKTYNRPIDVPSDEEPEWDAETEFWQGQRIERRPLAADEKNIYLGMDLKKNLSLKKLIFQFTQKIFKSI